MYERPAPKILQEIKSILCYIDALIPDSGKLFYEIYSCSSLAENNDILKSLWNRQALCESSKQNQTDCETKFGWIAHQSSFGSHCLTVDVG